MDLSCKGGASVKGFEATGTLSKSGLVPKAGHVRGAGGKKCMFQSFVRDGNLGFQDFGKREIVQGGKRWL